MDDKTQFVLNMMCATLCEHFDYRILEKDAITLPDEAIDFLRQARLYKLDLEQTLKDHFIKKRLTECDLSDKRLAAYVLGKLDKPFPIRKFHEDVGAYGMHIVHYPERSVESLLYWTAHFICYSDGYKAGIRKLKENGIQREYFGPTAADHIEGVVLALRDQFDNIATWLRETILVTET